VLIIFGGLPGSGKSTVARLAAGRLAAVHLRIDTIEQAVITSGLARPPVGPVGYVVAYAQATEFLRAGFTVLADSVNPLPITRESWRGVARTAEVAYLEVEVVCSDPAEHERRLGGRARPDLPDLNPTWADVRGRDYQPWRPAADLVVDTAGRSAEECAADLLSLVAARAAPAQRR
jgi:predicted kinase